MIKKSIGGDIYHLSYLASNFNENSNTGEFTIHANKMELPPSLFLTNDTLPAVITQKNKNEEK